MAVPKTTIPASEVADLLGLTKSQRIHFEPAINDGLLTLEEWEDWLDYVGV